MSELRWGLYGPIEQRTRRRLARQALEHLHALSLRFHLARRTGQISRVLENGLNGGRELLFDGVFLILPLAAEIVFVAIVMLARLDAVFAAILIATILLYGTTLVAGSEWLRAHQRKAVVEASTAHGKAIDSLLNYETVKYFANEDYEARRYDEQLGRWQAAAEKSWFALGLLNGAQAIVIASGLTVLMWLAASEVAAGKMTVGDLVLITTLLIQLFVPLNILGMMYRDIKQALTDMQRMFELIGEKPKVARRHAEAVLKLETAMAKAFMSKEDRRDPDKTKNKMTIAQFQALVPKLNVSRYFSNIGCPPMETLNVRQPAYFQALNKLLTKVSLNDWRVYLRWQLIRSSSSALPAAFGDASFEFFGKTMQGSKEREPRWMRMISATNSALGEALGQLYVAKHFKPEAKAKMLELIALLQDAFRESINERTWMSEETRANALAKLDAFVPMIGYPDKWRDYSELHIDRTSFAANCLRSDEFEHKADLAKIGKPVDQSEWHMTPQTVNAYYSPQSNRIVFPAAILQDPFFDPEADFAFNCGGILVVIGHEESHGFDDKGCRYDGQGNLRNWFAEGDLDKFMVLINLLKNAHESGSPPGEVALELEPRGAGVELRVLDRGAGMTDAVLQQALLPFYSTKPGGTCGTCGSKRGGGAVSRLTMPV